jgi:hypothetical protein
VPLAAECVFLRARYLRGRGGQALIISLKTPSRSAANAERWARYHAGEAAAQAKSAVATLKKDPFGASTIEASMLDQSGQRGSSNIGSV